MPSIMYAGNKDYIRLSCTYNVFDGNTRLTQHIAPGVGSEEWTGIFPA